MGVFRSTKCSTAQFSTLSRCQCQAELTAAIVIAVVTGCGGDQAASVRLAVQVLDHDVGPPTIVVNIPATDVSTVYYT